MVDGAIEESELLSRKWMTLSTNLRSMLTRGLAALDNDWSAKKAAFIYIRDHLEALRRSWEKVGCHFG